MKAVIVHAVVQKIDGALYKDAGCRLQAAAAADD